MEKISIFNPIFESKIDPQEGKHVSLGKLVSKLTGDYLDSPFTDPKHANAKTGEKGSSCGG